MDTYSSGEDFVVKTRKPYTITKQRERWTEDEHNRFLEALKLYGRAWQRIEEHIGTKTAVQIRSHAQKFFSKLEKEALVKGVPVGQALDIDIPPPRPKRKPSNPYPRKTCPGTPTSLAGGAKDGKFLLSESSHCKQMLDSEKEQHPAKPCGEGKPTNAEENQGDNCSEVLTQLQGTHYSSACNSSAPKPPIGLGNACSFREFVPSTKKANQDDTNGSYVTVELTRNQNVQKPDVKEVAIEDNDTSKGLQLEGTNALREKFVQGEKMNSNINCRLPTEEMQTTQNYPRHVPVHVVDGSVGTTQTHSPDVPFQEPNFHPVGEVHCHANFFASSAASATTEHQTNAPRYSGQQSFQAFNPPLTATRHNQEDYQSFLHMSSTFSRLIVSTLLQNPAAHAAASIAATFWPHSNGKTSADSPASNQGEFSLRQVNSAPSMAAIAAATVAAATAWWAAHGLLPLCAPLHTAFTCTPSVDGIPSIDAGQAPAAKTGEENSLNPPLQDQMEPEYSEAMQAQHSASKSSSSDSEESGGAKLNSNGEAKLNSNTKAAADENAAETTELLDANKAKSRKQVDRSSCGSNTASSSDLETDALGKKDNGNEELKETENNNPISETNIRRSRSNSNSSDSWKEVSEEGRLAFQALFSREVLPQSFSPPPDLKNQENQNGCMKEDRREKEENDGATSLLDLNIKTWGFCYNLDESEKNGSPNGDNLDDGLLTIGLGQGRLKARRTGFKPYKRCSVEAKENRVGNPGSQVEERETKRLRLEGEVQH